MKTMYIFALLSFATACSADNEFKYYADLGTWFGGDTVARNPGGDNYNAGSGAALDLGFEKNIVDEYQVFNRTSLGYRYQGAKVGNGGNRGIILETAALKRIGLFSFGAGIHSDFQNYVKDEFGTRTNLKDKTGIFLVADYMIFDTWGFSVKYNKVEYTSEAGDVFDGSQFGLFLSGAF